jgi:hypothetical protein
LGDSSQFALRLGKSSINHKPYRLKGRTPLADARGAVSMVVHR